MGAELETIDGYIDGARTCVVEISETNDMTERRRLGMKAYEHVTFARHAILMAEEKGIDCDDRADQLQGIAANALRSIYT